MYCEDLVPNCPGKQLQFLLRSLSFPALIFSLLLERWLYFEVKDLQDFISNFFWLIHFWLSLIQMSLLFTSLSYCPIFLRPVRLQPSTWVLPSGHLEEASGRELYNKGFTQCKSFPSRVEFPYICLPLATLQYL